LISSHRARAKTVSADATLSIIPDFGVRLADEFHATKNGAKNPRDCTDSMHEKSRSKAPLPERYAGGRASKGLARFIAQRNISDKVHVKTAT
jgi:hypothetical protein